MRRSLFTIALLFLFSTTKAQCPDGATAIYGTYVHIVGLGPGGPIIDTSCWFNVFNFQPLTTVYFYNYNSILIDSAVTLSNGSGGVYLRPSLLDSICGPFGDCGFATNGICTTATQMVALLPLKIAMFTVSANNRNVDIKWQMEMDEPGTKYVIQRSDDGRNFKDIHQKISTSSNIGQYSWSGNLLFGSTTYFRIRIISNSGKISYSEVKTIDPALLNDIIVQSPSAEYNVLVKVPQSFLQGSYTVFNTAGCLINKSKITSSSFIVAASKDKGVYFIRFTDIYGKSVTKPLVVLE